MTKKNDAREYLKAAGVAPEQIAAFDAQIDQGRAWVADAMPLAVSSTIAYREGRFEDAVDIGRQLELGMHAIGLDQSHPAAAVLEALMAQAAALYLEVHKECTPEKCSHR